MNDTDRHTTTPEASEASRPRPYVQVDVQPTDPHMDRLAALLAATERQVVALTAERDSLTEAVEQLRARLRERPAAPPPAEAEVSVAELASYRGMLTRALDIRDGRSRRFGMFAPVVKVAGYIIEGGPS